MKIKSFESFKGELFKDSEFREAFFNRSLENEIASIIIRARATKGLSQEDVADLMGTKQSAISRIEKGKTLPRLSFLKKMAVALKTRLLPPTFEFLERERLTADEYITGKLFVKNHNLISSNDCRYELGTGLPWTSYFTAPSSENSVAEVCKESSEEKYLSFTNC